MHFGQFAQQGPRAPHPATVESDHLAGMPDHNHLDHPAGRAIRGQHRKPDLRRELVPREVLVVEDDDKLAALIRRILIRTGFEPRLASTGDAALRAMRSHQPAAVVVDVMIPHPDGIEVCRQFRRDGWIGPIVAISARQGPKDRERVVAAGADAFLSKPFRLADLVSTLRELDDRRITT